MPLVCLPCISTATCRSLTVVAPGTTAAATAPASPITASSVPKTRISLYISWPAKRDAEVLHAAASWPSATPHACSSSLVYETFKNTSHGYMSSGMPLVSKMCAASGSYAAFASPHCVVFPPAATQPPIQTIRATLDFTSSGYMRISMAMLVRGPKATTSIGFSSSCKTVLNSCTACSWQGFLELAGTGGVKSPRPSWPWISGQ
mmetsp:Transcript_6439/g.19022  ORF Transcript_6439/g.19022 Transcript_6439/m.19022 type:complete len:204 (+) Transcript_6439:208-819(+)